MAVQTVTFTLNGQTTTLTKGSGNVWSATITAPSATSGSNNSGSGPGVGAAAQGKGYYPGTVTVTDDAGNSVTKDVSDGSFGELLKLKVLEKTKPTVVINSPGSGAYLTNAQPEIKFTVTDSGSGVNPAACFISIDGGTATAIASSSVSVSGSTATCTYTPSSAMSEGSHTITVYAIDYDGNQSESVSTTFTIDTVPPTLNVSAPVDASKTNAATCTVSGTTNDATSSPVTLKVSCGGTEQTVDVGSGGVFSTTVTLAEGSNTITITATDKAGKVSTVTRTVTLDTSPPSITAITLTPNPVDGGATYVVSVTVTD